MRWGIFVHVNEIIKWEDGVSNDTDFVVINFCALFSINSVKFRNFNLQLKALSYLEIEVVRDFILYFDIK